MKINRTIQITSLPEFGAYEWRCVICGRSDMYDRALPAERAGIDHARNCG